MLHAHGRKNDLVQNIQGIAICKSTAPQWRFGHLAQMDSPAGVITIPNAPKLISNFPGPGSIVLLWPPQICDNEVQTTYLVIVGDIQ